MRPGSSAAQQTLTTEAASVLKQSLTLARRRGHSQVTPLHVAATLLTSRASLLRRACIKSQLIMPHNHPLQCRALELCFNVALNRLPTTTSTGLGPGPGQPLFHHHPSLSNALIAALKRAQAHQKRGCVELQNQQHEQGHLLNVRVELEQLIISILDDPSVSRVMREAGFSSSAVKNHLEEDFFSASVSGSSPLGFQCRNGGGVFSSPSSPSPPKAISPPNFWNTNFPNCPPEQNPVFNFSNSPPQKGDLRVVFDILMRKQRQNTVLVGDGVSVTEGLVSEVIGRVERGEVPDELKQTHFIRFQFASNLRFMSRENVDMDLAHLKRKVDDSISSSLGQSEAIVVIYVGDLKWIFDCESSPTTLTGVYSPVDHLISEMRKLIDDYGSSSSKSKVWLMGAASYETYMKCQMKQPSLEVLWSLQAVPVQSGGLGLSLHASSRELVLKADADEYKLNCCAECNSNYEKEVAFFSSGQQKHIPSWLQSHGSKGGRKEFVDLRRKWNQSCLSLHQGHTHSAYASSHTWLPKQNTISFVDSNNFPRLRRQHSCTFELGSANKHQVMAEPRLDSLKNTEGSEVKITLALGNSSISSPRKIPEQRIGGKVINEREMYKILEENVPGKSETISLIVETLVNSISIKKDTWFLIEGNDFAGKRRLASAIAEGVCGSTDFLFQLNMRKVDTGATSSIEILTRFLRNREKLVVLIENVDLADAQFMKLLACRYETGTHDQQAIFILTTGDDAMSNQEKMMYQNQVIQMKLQVNYTNTNSVSDHKRKAELDLSNSSKNPRIDDKKDGSSVTIESSDNKNNRKDLSPQSSVNTLDLNIKVDEEDELCSLTRDRENNLLGSIKNRFVFNCAPSQMRDTILSKIEGSVEGLLGCEEKVCISVEDRVLEELVGGSSFFVNSLFEKWLEDVLQSCLVKKVNIGWGNGIRVSLCYGGKSDRNMEGGGYMDSCLPKNIQVSFVD